MIEEHQHRPVVLLGPSRSGKNEVAKYWYETYGITYGTSSWEACKVLVREQLSMFYDLKYESLEDCYHDRHNHREKWFRLIATRAHYEPLWLASRIFAKARVYIGLRGRAEYDAIKKTFNPWFVWVHPGDRVPMEPTSSNQLTADDADRVLHNNRTLSEALAVADEMALDLFSHAVHRKNMLDDEVKCREDLERQVEDLAKNLDRLRVHLRQT